MAGCATGCWSGLPARGAEHARSQPPALLRRLAAGVGLAALLSCSGGYAVIGGTGDGPGDGGGGGSGGVTGVFDGPDDPPPANAFYVATDGNDSNPGTQAQPWRTVARGVRDLGPGDTLVLRGGTYNETGIDLSLAGTAALPITIRSFPDEDAVLNGALPQFRTAPNQDWEVVDAARNLFRSVATFDGADTVFGYFGDTNGGFRLVPYETLAALSAEREDYANAQAYYCGPGVFWNSADRRIYVRLVRGRYQARLGFAVPSNVDPRQTPLFLFPERPIFELSSSTAHVVLDGIDLVYCEKAIEIPAGSHHLTFRRGKLLGGRYEVLIRGGHHFVFDAMTVRGQFPPWVARSDVKAEPNKPAHLMQGAGMALEGTIDNVEIGHSIFQGLFDAIDTSDVTTNLRVHHCTFTTIRDDAFEIATRGHHIEFDHNVVTRTTQAVSWAGSTAPPLAQAGTKFVHHNVIDVSTLQLYGRDDPLNQLPSKWRGPAGDGMGTGPAFSLHDTEGLNGPDPWKIYHNTILGGADVDTDGLGHAYRFPGASSSVPHEVWNNILVQTANQWIARDARVADGSQLFDGNLYHRSFGNPTTPLLLEFDNNGAQASFPALVNFLTSAHWLASRVFYAPGWELAGVQGNPQLDAEYRPASGGPAATGAVDLSARNLPGYERVNYRGALAPR